MKPIALGARHSFIVETQYRDTAEAFGNAGVALVGTPALIGFLETAADRCLKPYYEGKEGSLGTIVDVAHLAPAPANSTIEASAEVVGIEGRKFRFAVAAQHGSSLLMKGLHERVVVDTERFLAKLADESARR